MSYGTYHSYGGSGGDRVPGGRREKLKGYLKAANELRQSYQEQITQKLTEGSVGESITGCYYARRYAKERGVIGRMIGIPSLTAEFDPAHPPLLRR